MDERETLDEVAEKYADIHMERFDLTKSHHLPFQYNDRNKIENSFEAGAKWAQEQYEMLYKSIRELRNELRDKFEEADLHEAGRLRQQVKGIDMILTKIEQFNID